jgi:hypothetical protein
MSGNGWQGFPVLKKDLLRLPNPHSPREPRWFSHIFGGGGKIASIGKPCLLSVLLRADTIDAFQILQVHFHLLTKADVVLLVAGKRADM